MRSSTAQTKAPESQADGLGGGYSIVATERCMSLQSAALPNADKAHLRMQAILCLPDYTGETRGRSALSTQ